LERPGVRHMHNIGDTTSTVSNFWTVIRLYQKFQKVKYCIARVYYVREGLSIRKGEMGIHDCELFI
jgi:hypothetical protein